MENKITKLDDLIEKVETISNEITKLNFEMDGFKEEADRLVEKQPYMVRYIQQNEKRMFKMSTQLIKKMEQKHEFDAELNVERALYQAAHPQKALDVPKKNKESTKKILSKKVKEVSHDKNN